jgi:hypothetical protein
MGHALRGSLSGAAPSTNIQIDTSHNACLSVCLRLLGINPHLVDHVRLVAAARAAVR